jgi:hypothetical protein
MSTRAQSKELGVNFDNVLNLDLDPRWAFVQNIVKSPLFAKSERLSRFLLFICAMSLDGRNAEINEQSIGEKVFGRPISYDAANDGIVRSHAVRLRERLKMYSSQPEQINAPYVLEIPKGAYIPVFAKREVKLPPGDTEATHDPKLEEEIVALPATLAHLTRFDGDIVRTESHFTSRRIFWCAVAVAILATSLFWTLVTGIYLASHTSRSRFSQLWRSIPDSHHPLWPQLFNGDMETDIIMSDTGLVTAEVYGGHHVTLSEYAANGYVPKILTGAQFPRTDQTELDNLRYTSIIDALTIQRIYSLPGLDLSRTTVRYSRDVHLSELKGRNVVFTGTNGSAPWVALYEQKMNFYSSAGSDQQHSGAFINRHPVANEQAVFDIHSAAPAIYAVAAYQPGLEGRGDVLILEGQGMAGTESAVDFVLDDQYFLPFLSKIKRPDGTIPYFEVVLKTMSLNGDAPQFEVIAYRVE